MDNNNNNKVPDFLVIGAMKAGTTTFCSQLAKHRDVFFPSVKEPHTLMTSDVMSAKGLAGYSKLFSGAGDALCGEGSTGYTKMPWSRDVPERARLICGDGLKLIYVVRDPVERAISHHYHLYRAGEAGRSFAEAVAKHPAIIRCGLYAMQMESWLKCFSLENFLVVTFDELVEDQQAVISRSLEFLGSHGKIETSPVGHLNSGLEQHVPINGLGSLRRLIARSQFYKQRIAPRISKKPREILRKMLYRSAPSPPSKPSRSELERLIKTFETDLGSFRELMCGRDCKIWTGDELREKHIRG